MCIIDHSPLNYDITSSAKELPRYKARTTSIEPVSIASVWFKRALIGRNDHSTDSSSPTKAERTDDSKKLIKHKTKVHFQQYQIIVHVVIYSVLYFYGFKANYQKLKLYRFFREFGNPWP